MHTKEYRFGYDVYESLEDLPAEWQSLVKQTREITATAYAPYSHFQVAAVARLQNGATVTGTNQENASYPVGICAERVLLSAASVLHTNVPIDTMAISYHHIGGDSGSPVSPCGMCRQALLEYQDRTKQAIRLILSGMSGKIIVIEQASALLPLSFGGENLR